MKGVHTFIDKELVRFTLFLLWSASCSLLVFENYHGAATFSGCMVLYNLTMILKEEK